MKRIVIAEDNLIFELCTLVLADAKREEIIILKQGNIGAVGNVMRDKYANNLVIGVVDRDDDKRFKSPYLLRFDEFAHEGTMPQHDESVIVRRYPAQILPAATPLHSLLLLKPPSDAWTLQCAAQADISSKTFGLPTELTDLRRITKSNSLSSNQSFKQFLFALRRANPAPMVALQAWLNHELQRTIPPM
jgi:hypothetical protein